MTRSVIKKYNIMSDFVNGVSTPTTLSYDPSVVASELQSYNGQYSEASYDTSYSGGSYNFSEPPDTTIDAFLLSKGMHPTKWRKWWYGTVMPNEFNAWSNYQTNKWQSAQTAYQANYNSAQGDLARKVSAGYSPYSDASGGTSGNPASLQSYEAQPKGFMSGVMSDPLGTLMNIASSVIGIKSSFADLNIKDATAKKLNAEADYLTQSQNDRLNVLKEQFAYKNLVNGMLSYRTFGDTNGMSLLGFTPHSYYQPNKNSPLASLLDAQLANLHGNNEVLSDRHKLNWLTYSQNSQLFKESLKLAKLNNKIAKMSVKSQRAIINNLDTWVENYVSGLEYGTHYNKKMKEWLDPDHERGIYQSWINSGAKVLDGVLGIRGAMKPQSVGRMYYDDAGTMTGGYYEQYR